MNWKKGDWCFCEFGLHLIKDVRDDGGMTLGDGVVEKSGDFQCFPLDYRVLQISNTFKYYYEKLHSETEPFNLNWPDIHRWFVSKWSVACSEKDDDKAINQHYSELQEFTRTISNECKDARLKTVSGVRAFR